MSCKNLVWGKRRKLFQGCVRVYSLNFRIVWSILDPDSVLHKNSMDWKWQENNNYVKISSNSSKGFESSSTIAIYSSLSSTLSGKTHNVNSPNKKNIFLKKYSEVPIFKENYNFFLPVSKHIEPQTENGKKNPPELYKKAPKVGPHISATEKLASVIA